MSRAERPVWRELRAYCRGLEAGRRPYWRGVAAGVMAAATSDAFAWRQAELCWRALELLRVPPAERRAIARWARHVAALEHPDAGPVELRGLAALATLRALRACLARRREAGGP